MEIITYLKVLRRRWLLIATTLAVALGLAYTSAPKAKIYQASSTLVVGPGQISVDPDRPDAGANPNGLANLTATYSLLLKSEVVAEEAVRRAKVARAPGGVVAATTTTAVVATQVLLVTVVDPEPAVAQALANGMASAFVDRVNSISSGGPSSTGSLPAVPVYLYQPAGLPGAPLASSNRTRLFTAGLFALLASGGAVLLLEHLDLSLRSVGDAERRLDLPVLGAVPLLGDRAEARG